MVSEFSICVGVQGGNIATVGAAVRKESEDVLFAQSSTSLSHVRERNEEKNITLMLKLLGYIKNTLKED